jgi:hypothetical protein
MKGQAQSSFGLVPVAQEGKPFHPNGWSMSDAQYLTQLQGYADWRGLKETLETECERPWLLEKLV